MPATYKLYVQTNTPRYPDTWHGASDFGGATPVDLNSADATANIALISTHTLSGSVTGAGGAALAGAYVHAFNATTGAWTGWTLVSPGGTYSLTLAAATYKLYVQTNTPGCPDTWHGASDFGGATPVDLNSADGTANIIVT